jgi:hypothetical protein
MTAGAIAGDGSPTTGIGQRYLCLNSSLPVKLEEHSISNLSLVDSTFEWRRAGLAVCRLQDRENMVELANTISRRLHQYGNRDSINGLTALIVVLLNIESQTFNAGSVRQDRTITVMYHLAFAVVKANGIAAGATVGDVAKTIWTARSGFCSKHCSRNQKPKHHESHWLQLALLRVRVGRWRCKIMRVS